MENFGYGHAHTGSTVHIAISLVSATMCQFLQLFVNKILCISMLNIFVSLPVRKKRTFENEKH